MKNVTGLDLARLLAGSHGTLGVVTEVALKVLPAPEATVTLTLRALDAARAVAALSAALGLPLRGHGAPPTTPRARRPACASKASRAPIATRADRLAHLLAR
jgi:glycolate oxidase FAD binding subunit